MKYNSDQEKYWAEQYAINYIKKNEVFDHTLGVQAWKLMLAKIESDISSLLECGCNIGRNIEQLNRVIPKSQKSIIEISEPAYNFVTQKYDLSHTFHGPLIDSNFKELKLDVNMLSGKEIQEKNLDFNQVFDKIT